MYDWLYGVLAIYLGVYTIIFLGSFILGIVFEEDPEEAAARALFTCIGLLMLLVGVGAIWWGTEQL